MASILEEAGKSSENMLADAAERAHETIDAAEEEAAEIIKAAEHRAGEIDFVWDGQIVGEPSGRITFSLDGVCRRPFRKNRLGF